MILGDILQIARHSGVRIGTAESCTGGLVAAKLSETPGSSDVFEGGFVTYSNAAKKSLLGVRPESLGKFGAVSEEVAREMVLGVLSALNVEIAVSVTGIAGPGGSEHKPEGRVCFGIVGPSGQPSTKTIEFGPLGRDAVRQAACDEALQLILGALRAAS